MKFLRLLFVPPVLFILFLFSSAPISGCKKEIVHDTIIVRHDTTIIKRDTTVIRDSIYDITSGLVAYYNFKGGSLHDSSGYGNDIIFNSATQTSDRFGIPGNAYSFDGSTSYMKVTNSASINPDNITLMAIVKFNAFNTGTCKMNQILMKGSADEDIGVYGLRVIQADGNCYTPLDTATEKFKGVFGNYGANSYVIDSNYFVHTKTWYTVVYTYDGLTSKIYVNGQLHSTRVMTAQLTDNNSDLFIGKTQNPSFPYLFNGVINEIRIYNRALNLGAIKQLNNQTK